MGDGKSCRACLLHHPTPSPTPVGARGFEPPTLWSQTRCAKPDCATPRSGGLAAARRAAASITRHAGAERRIRIPHAFLAGIEQPSVGDLDPVMLRRVGKRLRVGGEEDKLPAVLGLLMLDPLFVFFFLYVLAGVLFAVGQDGHDDRFRLLGIRSVIEYS